MLETTAHNDIHEFVDVEAILAQELLVFYISDPVGSPQPMHSRLEQLAWPIYSILPGLVLPTHLLPWPS